MQRPLRVVVEGCCHGQLDQIYDAIAQRYSEVDLVLICGDFQAVRNEQDLNCMSVPRKYRQLGDFHKYYHGIKKAPYLTIFIGGNHEASNYLQELRFGGWVAPNIYYLGSAGCVQYKGLRICGLSGIYNHANYHAPRTEKSPYDGSSIRSVYHVRDNDVQLLSLLQNSDPIDVLLTHDWPRGIWQFGNQTELLKKKPFFGPDIQKGELGSPAAESLLHYLQPRYHFSAHLHVRFQATITHQDQSTLNPDEIDISDHVDPVSNVPPINDRKKPINAIALGNQPSSCQGQLNNVNPDELDLGIEITPEVPSDVAQSPAHHRTTEFLALDKCLPGRKFVELLEIVPLYHNHNEPDALCYDPQWMAILRAYLSNGGRIPDIDNVSYQRQWISRNITNLAIPHNFYPTVPTLEQLSQDTNIPIRLLATRQPATSINQQTRNIFSVLGL
uniref:ARAD1D38720p n=1 Tax=Blastobotrys adeninivorans TaxID=409370 RepID=A0A060TCU5_BLAAD